MNILLPVNVKPGQMLVLLSVWSDQIHLILSLLHMIMSKHPMLCASPFPLLDSLSGPGGWVMLNFALAIFLLPLENNTFFSPEHFQIGNREGMNRD